MPIIDLFASSRRILRKLLPSSRHIALAAALVPLGSVGMQAVKAAPYVTPPNGFPSPVFSVRITDMERVPGDTEQNAFRIEFEVLDWTGNSPAGLVMSTNLGTTALVGTAPFIADASIDPDGRGGPSGGNDIGPGVFDPIAIHSGRGRGDIPSAQNDWHVKFQTSTSVQWDIFEGPLENPTITGTRLYNPRGAIYHNLPPSPDSNPNSSVPGFGKDGLGDTAIDGGPGPYTPSTPGYGVPTSLNNVLDGFVIDVDDWDVGEVFSVNWFLTALINDSSAGRNYFVPIGNADLYYYYPGFYGFGTMNLVRIDPSIARPPAVCPGQCSSATLALINRICRSMTTFTKSPTRLNLLPNLVRPSRHHSSTQPTTFSTHQSTPAWCPSRPSRSSSAPA